MQVRLPLGVEQYEMDGRPDGAQPYGFPSALDRTQDRLRRHIVETGSDAGFLITTTEAAELQSEGVLYYYRYLLLFRLGHYDLVIRDTDHNLHLCDLLERYCQSEEARDAVLQFQPYILRMNAAARAIAIERGELSGDFHEVIETTIQRIGELEEIDSPAFQFERIRSVNYLRTLARKLDAEPDASDVPDATDESDQIASRMITGDDRSRLQHELQEAVDAEDYERAARIRDTLRRRDR
jgi:hypothetical protein